MDLRRRYIMLCYVMLCYVMLIFTDSPPASHEFTERVRGGPSSQKMRARETQRTLLVAIACVRPSVRKTRTFSKLKPESNLDGSVRA